MDTSSSKSFKGTGNMESISTGSSRIRACSGHRLQKSGTRKRISHPEGDLNRIWVLRKVLNPLSPVEAMELLLDNMGKTKGNTEFPLGDAKGDVATITIDRTVPTLLRETT